MQKHSLKAEKRTVEGKKVKNLRRQGVIPANVYGKDIKSENLQINLKDFEKTYQEAGKTGIVELNFDTGEPKNTLIRNVQKDPVTGNPLHVDFYNVSLKEKIKASVPVVQIGESKAVIDKVGALLQPLAQVEVEALPTDLPENIEVDVTQLSAVDEEIKVKDLKVASGVTILTDPEQIVIKVGSLISEEAKKLAEEEAAAKAAAEAAAVPAEGTAPTEGTAPADVSPEAQSAKGEAAPPESKPAPETKPAEKPQEKG